MTQEKNNSNNSNNMLLFGVVAIGILGLCGLYSMNSEECNNNDDEYDEYDEYKRQMNRSCMVENYACNSGNSVETTIPPPPIIQPESYVPPNFKHRQEHFEHEDSSLSPLGFGTMAGGTTEEYIGSDYKELKEYDEGSQNIPVFNEIDGQVGLPVPDMTDISAGENNKYVYDRTIGTIGFTSTKIGGRRRGQADYVRGDLAIIPDKNSHFQVSADPLNSLLQGAMNASNGIGETNAADISNAQQFSNSSSGVGAQRAMRSMSGGTTKPLTLDGLRALSYNNEVNEVKNNLRKDSTGGGQRAPAPASVITQQANMAIQNAQNSTQYDTFKPANFFQGGTVPGLTVADIQAAAIQQALQDNASGKPISTYGYS
jgi:hypothetical protein